MEQATLGNNISADTIDQSKNYISQIASTLEEMDVRTTKLHNLATDTISKLVGTYSSLVNFVKESSQVNMNFYLYASSDNYNLNMTIYTSLLKGNTRMSYFKAKYSFLNYELYLKVAGPLGGQQSLQNVIPIILGRPLVRTADKTITLSIDLSNEGVIYGIIVLAANASSPSAVQLASKVDGNGQTPVGFYMAKNSLDSNYNFVPGTLVFQNLTNNIKYTVFYAPGLPVPEGRDPIISETIYNINATAKNPLSSSGGRRVLLGDEDF